MVQQSLGPTENRENEQDKNVRMFIWATPSKLCPSVLPGTLMFFPHIGFVGFQVRRLKTRQCTTGCGNCKQQIMRWWDSSKCELSTIEQADVPHITTYHHYSPLKNPWFNPWFTQFPQRWADRSRSRLSEWTRSDVLHVAFVRVQLLTQIHDRLDGSNGGVFQCQAARGYNLLQDTNRNFLPSRGNGFHADFPPSKSATLVSEMISAGCQEAKLILTLPSIETSTSKLSWIGAVCTTYNSHDDSAVYLYMHLQDVLSH